jgi:hypothetical protein
VAGQPSVTAGATAIATATSPAPVDRSLVAVSLSHLTAEEQSALDACNVGSFDFSVDKISGIARIPHATDVTRYVPLTGREPELKTDEAVWVIAFSGDLRVPRRTVTARDPVCVVVGGEGVLFLPWGTVGSKDLFPDRTMPTLSLPPLEP